MIPEFGQGVRPEWPAPAAFEVTLPNGDSATASSLEAIQLAAETLIDDASRYLRENLVIKRDGEIDATATAMAQQPGMLV